MQIKACRSCGAAIFFASTESGKAIPMDPQPTAQGNMYVFDLEGDPVALSEQSGDVRVQAERKNHARRYRSHFATCPRASEHRR